MIREGDLLWTPSASRIEKCHLTAFMGWLEAKRGLRFTSYESLWRWSVDDLEAFWGAVWQYFAVESSAPYRRVLADARMPGADWFPGARLNYAQHALRHERPDGDALLYSSERAPLGRLSWPELGGKVRVLATQLRRLDVRPGDRVVAYLPNGPEAIIAMLATTSIGAIWSSCGPDFGTRGVLDRFAQLAPKVLICVDGYQYGGKPFHRKAELAEIIDQLDSLEHIIYLPYLDPDDRDAPSARSVLWADLLAGPPVDADGFAYEQVPFGHPLWILFSSGTTGLPKPIVHSHGGILLEQLKSVHFHMDLHAGERLFFFTTTGWMMWNFLAGALLAGGSPILYDGNPTWPGADVLWRMAEEAEVSFFGASPAYVALLERAGIVPKERFGLSRLKTILVAGAPVTPECMHWFYRNVKEDLWVQNGSGGTDICSGFVGGVPILPVRAGEMQARHLGVDAHAFDDRGRSVIDELGELVVTQPMPSMPVQFWNDTDGKRYLESYFQEFPGIWRHGDFFRVNQHGGCFVLGRSDATLNRHGVRIGTAEIYRSLATVPGVEDSLVVNLDLPGGRSFMPLFVKLAPGVELDEALAERIRDVIRTDYSPRHVPDKIYQVPDIPYTLTLKKMEVPVRRILTGMPAEKAANRDAVANPHALDFFVTYARRQRDYSL